MRRLQAAGGAALTPRTETGGQAPRRLAILLTVAACVYAADVVSKIVVVATLSDGPVRLLGGLLTLRLLRNSGAAFSIGTSMTIVFTVIAVIVIFFIVRTSRRLYSLPWAVALGLLLGGATGNLTDRLLRAPGAFRGDVVDWIQLPHFAVFNVADSAIVCGGILAVLLAAQGIHLDGSREGQSRGTGPGGGADGGGAGGAGKGTAGADGGGAGGAGKGTAGADRGGAGGAGKGTAGADGAGAGGTDGVGTAGGGRGAAAGNGAAGNGGRAERLDPADPPQQAPTDHPAGGSRA